jgi:CO/xanthine dehydrogenase FAD-binding subunit
MNDYPEFFQARSLTELLEKLPREKRVYFLAGGTDLLCSLRDGLLDGENICLADVSLLSELQGIAEGSDYIRIGSGATFAEILENDLTKKWAPVLVKAAQTIGTPQIKNRATIGGNIGTASPAGDSLPALAIHEAELELNRFGERRLVKILDIFVGPKKTNLANGEIVVAIKIPKKPGWFGNFLKIGGRRSHGISKMAIAVYLCLRNKIVEDINIAIGSAAPTVVLAKRSAQILRGQSLTDKTLQEAVQAFSEVACPIDDFRSTAEYRRKILGPVFRQVLSEITSIGQ